MPKILFPFFLFPLICLGQVEAARKTVETLCSPNFHGRGYVNGGDSLAADYIHNAFAQAGCKSFTSGPFQSFDFPVNTFPDRMSLSISGKTLTPGTEFVIDPGSGGGNASDINLIEVTINDVYNPKQIKNKIASTNQLGGGRGKNNIAFYFDLVGLKGDSLKRTKQLVKELNSTFAVIELVEGKFTWSVEQTQTNFPYFQVQRSAIDLSQETKQVSYTVDAKIMDHTARNVIAYVPAKKKSKKYMVFTAHYDHLGRMGQSTYFPGGNDNASGSAMLIELAKYYVAHPSDVNIVFIAFAGEEAGLLGSKYYTEHPVFPLDKIDFLFNIDIMGSGEDGITIVNATLFPKQFQKLDVINTEKKYVVKIGQRGAAANSDHYFFSQKGVPAFFMYTMGPNKHYHDVLDTYAELSFNEFNDLFHLLVDFHGSLQKK